MRIDTYNASFSMLSQYNSDDFDSFDIKDIRYRTLRIMSALGHCEVDFDRRFISVCPPSLVALPNAGSPRAVWSGARSESLVKKMSQIEKLKKDELSITIFNQEIYTGFSRSQKSSFPLPYAIIFEVSSEEVIKQIIDGLKIKFFLQKSPVLSLINFSADIIEIKNSIHTSQLSEPNWISSIFDKLQLKFVRNKPSEKDATLSSYICPISQQRVHIFWENGKGYEIDRDWGRWLILSEYKKNVIIYDKRLQILAIPATLPLPILLARALTLCSGRSPLLLKEEQKIGDIPPSHPLDGYLSVPLQIAEAMTKKLNQNLLFHTLDRHNVGK
jgi:hypothetical protein